MKTAAAALLLFTSTAQAADETTPTCSSNESLLTLNITSKFHMTHYPAGYSLSLQDVTSANTTYECTNCEFNPKQLEGGSSNRLTSLETSICLPKDHCHRFLVGTTMYRMFENQRIVDDFDSFTLTWDGEDLLDGFNAYSFGRVDFGTCESVCTDDSVEFELFVTKDQTDFNQLSWNLTGSDGLIYEASAPEGPSLIHTIECVPKDECMIFHIGYPNDNNNAFYSVRLDGVMYADGEFMDWLPETKKLNIGSCQASDVCGEGESLIEVQLNFLDTFTQNGTEYYAIENGQLNYEGGVIDIGEVNWAFIRDSDRSDAADNSVFFWYEFGSSYALNRCIAEDECAQFAVNKRVIEGLDSYLVFENGEELTEHVTHEEGEESMMDLYDYAFDFEGTTSTGTSACPANIWQEQEPNVRGEPEQSSAARRFGILSSFVGAVAVCLAAV